MIDIYCSVSRVVLIKLSNILCTCNLSNMKHCLTSFRNTTKYGMPWSIFVSLEVFGNVVEDGLGLEGLIYMNLLNQNEN